MNVRFLGKTAKINIAILFPLLFILITVFSACREEKKDIVSTVFNPDSSYTMRTTDVVSLISDSGITRYKLITKEWLYYSKAADPFFHFPNGIHIEQFDSLFQTETTIKADTAYYYEKREFIKLAGHVDITNIQEERFETELLYWDQKEGKFYSDKFIKITQPGRITTGIGFEANQGMTKHKIFNIQGQYEYDETSNDSIKAASADSTKTTVEKMTPQKREPEQVAPKKLKLQEATPLEIKETD